MTSLRSTPPSGARRRTPSWAAAVGAIVVSATLLAACGSDGDNEAEAASTTAVAGSTGHETATPAGARSPSESALYQTMQNLWQQHMEWTYAAVAAFATDSPTFAATADRLLQNQVDIGAALVPFYGEEATHQLTTLLQDHIKGAVAILTAAKAGDSAAQETAVAEEYANAQEIGDFLAAANPTSWDEADMEAMMKTHIDQTLVYATDVLTGDYADGIAHYGEAEAHMVEMGDLLSAGLIAQFPDMFTK
jgi:hypothetical protein